ncbi:hypothetical protein [Clostridiisalibacter paucivorans]|uniref:hypothetical protein n=1 Tax=Clostridiisalibacter paucivorans TaxID=408753 RepID=UPI00047E8E80|nr:hypothetical protein [Clostridiisalibacter paucivorans]
MFNSKIEEETERVVAIADMVINDIGLKISIEKTKFVSFNDENFDFLGFTFKHWRKRKNG